MLLVHADKFSKNGTCGNLRMKDQEGQLDAFIGAQHLYHLPRNECCPSSLPSWIALKYSWCFAYIKIIIKQFSDLFNTVHVISAIIILRI